jgi:hypothetical protein
LPNDFIKYLTEEVLADGADGVSARLHLQQ